MNIHHTNPNKSSNDNFLFSKDELRKFEKSVARSRITKIVISITVAASVLIGALYISYLGTNQTTLGTVDNKSSQSLASPDSKSPLNLSSDSSASAENIKADEAAARAFKAQADKLNAQAKQEFENANKLGQQSQDNLTAVTKLDSSYQKSAQAYEQQLAANQVAQDQQAAQLVQCQNQKAAATAPIEQQIKLTNDLYSGTNNALKYTTYSSQPSSEYQRLYSTLQTESQQLSNLLDKLGIINRSYGC